MTLIFSLVLLNLFSTKPASDTTITGRAIDTKYGLAILCRHTIWHLRNTDNWHDSCYGRKITATGVVRKRQITDTQSHAEPDVAVHEETLWLINTSWKIAEPQKEWIKAAEKDLLVFIKNTPVKRGHLKLFDEHAATLAQPSPARRISSSTDSVFCMEAGEVFLIMDIDSTTAVATRINNDISITYGNLDSCKLVKGQLLKKGDFIGKAKPDLIYPSLFTVDIFVANKKGPFHLDYRVTKEYFINKSKEDWNIKQ